MTDERDDGRDGAGKGPDAFRTISEVADELGLPQHVLRFWETRFPQVKPVKRGGGRRYYRPADVDLLRGVKELLYGKGYTIRGVQRILREQGGRKEAYAAGLSVVTREVDEETHDEPVEFAAESQQSGPEAWAPSRRSHADPALRVDPAPDSARERSDVGGTAYAPSEPASASPGLTPGQSEALAMALHELRACRRLLDGRS